MKKTVAIAGAGIGGLTCALALRQSGIEAEVFEAAPELSPVGAGIWMASNAMQIFNRLGIAEEVLEAGIAMKRVMVLDDRLKPIVAVDQEAVQRRFGFGITAIHRAALQRVLARNFGRERLHLGKKLDAIRQGDNSVTATFGDGTEATAEVLIGADGVHSRTFDRLFGERRLRYSGQACWRAAVPFELPEQFEYSTAECWGKRMRFGFAHTAPKQVYWFAVKSGEPAQMRDPEATRAELLKTFSHFASPVAELIAAAAPADLICTNLYDWPPRLPWSKGNVCLIGDAAHPITPNLGQGGALAVEDGYSLAGWLAKSDSAREAFHGFEQRRFPRVKSVVDASYYSGAFIHAAWPSLRDFVFRATPASVANRQMESLFRLDGGI